MKNKLKILLVSSAFYPEISPRSFRATELAKEFYKQGHEVTVVTRYRDYDYNNFLAEYHIDFKRWSDNVLPDFSKKRSKYLQRIFGVVARLLLMLFEYPYIEEMFKVKGVLKKESGYDLMISFAVPYPVQWGVAWARKIKHQIAVVWIADCGDPYMGNQLDSFKKLFYFGFLEKWFFRKAEYVTIPVKSAIPAYYKEFHNKIKIIPQGFNFDVFKLNESPNNSVPKFAYAGGFLVGTRDPRALLDYLSTIDIPFEFYIYTNQTDLIDKYRSALNGKLIISDFIERNVLMDKLLEMDFLINFDNNTQLNVPSKLIDYAITGRPVLNISKDFREEEVGAFLKKDYSKKMELPNPKTYHIKNITKQFLELI